MRFYDDCVRILRKTVIAKARAGFPHLFTPNPVEVFGNCMLDQEKNHIIRAVVGIFRHGKCKFEQKFSCLLYVIFEEIELQSKNGKRRQKINLY